MKKEDKILEDQAWAQMRNILDNELPVQKKTRRGLFWWIGAVLLLMLSVFVFDYWLRSDENADETQSTQSTIYAANKAMKEEGAQARINQEDVFENDKGEVNESKPTVANANDNNNIAQESKVKASKSGYIDSPTATEALIIDKEQAAQSTIYTESEKMKISESNQDIKIDNKNRFQLDTKVGRAAIKDQLTKAYGKSSANKKFEVAATNNSDQLNRAPSTDKLLPSLRLIPAVPFSLNYVASHIRGIEDHRVDIGSIKNSDDNYKEWSLGTFASYQYVDQFYKGFDIGVMANYKINKTSLGVKIGYERIGNNTNQVLQNAAIGVSLDVPENTILQSSRSAGFDLNELILSKNNLMSEFTIAYNFIGGFNISTGIGYKRLLNVDTRSIFGINADDTSTGGVFDPSPNNSDSFSFDSNQVLSNPTVNRNRFYIPIEVTYSPIGNVQIGIGSQIFLNSTFTLFEESNRSIYTRVSYSF